MNTIIQHETYHKFPSGVEYWTFLLSRPPLAFKVMVSSRSLKSDSVDAFCASSVASIRKRYQEIPAKDDLGFLTWEWLLFPPSRSLCSYGASVFQVAGGVFKGRGAFLTFDTIRSLAGVPFKNIFTEEGGSLRYLLVYGYGRDQSVLFSLFTASGKRVSISVAWVHLCVGVASTWG